MKARGMGSWGLRRLSRLGISNYLQIYNPDPDVNVVICESPRTGIRAVARPFFSSGVCWGMWNDVGTAYTYYPVSSV